MYIEIIHWSFIALGISLSFLFIIDIFKVVLFYYLEYKIWKSIDFKNIDQALIDQALIDQALIDKAMRYSRKRRAIAKSYQ